MQARPITVASQRVIDAILTLEAAVDHAGLHREFNAGAREKLQEELTAGWEAKLSGVEADLDSVREENSQLKAENAALSNELHQLKQQYLALQQTAGKVAKKLDQSIGQLDMLMVESA